MYNLKKVIASICVIAMMLTTVAFAATYSDVAEDGAYYEAIETLNKLGIVTGYEDGTYKPEAGVTRAEMAALVARIQGYGESAAGQTATSFADVPASHWASGYVASAASTGIINGYGDGNFGPDDSVLFEQAVKMIMAALGYTPYAEYNGGYPGGYLAAAQRYNVTANVSNATMSTEANRGTIAQLLANAIDTPLMQQVGWTTNGEVDYVICDGKNGNDYKTLMSEYLNVVKIRGVVTENAYTNIYNEKTIDTEEDEAVEIAIVDAYDTTNKDFPQDAYGELITDSCPKDYLVGSSDAADYIGKSVIAYVQEVDDEWEIVSIVEDTTRNDILTIDLSQFNKINASGKFEYFKTTSAKTATAVALDGDEEEGLAVVYNNVGGFELENVVDEDEDGEEVIVEYGIFGPEEGGNIVLNEGATLDGGMITLIDNNDTKGYDVIFVEVAKTAVVDESEENYVAFKNSVYELDELEIDEDDTDRVVKVTKDGEEIALADLVEWDVLSVITVEGNDNYILAEVVSTEVVGTVTSESKSTTSAEGKAYKIGSDKYDVAEGAYGMPVNVGDGGTFYIDKYGKIAAFNEDAALASGIAANYAYVTAVAFDEDILTGKATAIVQMVTADGVVALNIKSTGAKLNGSTVPAITIDDEGVVTGGDDIDELVGQMIKYSKNSANNITNISTFDNEKLEDKMSGEMYAEVASAEYDADDNRFVGEFFMDANSYVFFIDEEEAEDSFLGTEADLADGEDYDIMGVYADKKADDNNIVIVKYEGGKAGRKAGLAVITSVGTSENEDGEAIYAIEALVNGEELAADTTADVETVVTPGDIVKIKVDGNGLIAAIDMVVDFDVDDNNNIVKAAETGLLAYAPEFDFDGIENGDEKIYGGKVLNYRKSSNTATLKIGTAEDEDGEEYDLTDEFKLSQAENIIVIDDNGRLLEVKKGSASSFKFYEDLYDAEVESVKVTVAGATKASAATKADAQNVADFVFVREYDGRVADVVIVKGPADTKVKAN